MAIEPNNDRDRQHGTSRIDPVDGPVKKKTNWLPWLLAALGIAALLFALSRCNREEPAPAPVEVNNTVDVNTADVSGTTAATGAAAAAGAATGNALNDMRTYLASGDAAGRRFTFDNINFAPGSADLPADAQTTVTGVAQALQAHPSARVKVEGYADASGDAASNRDLGARRAQALKTALTGAGIAADRVETGTGGEANPVDSNATTGGRSDNRRTDIVVTAK